MEQVSQGWWRTYQHIQKGPNILTLKVIFIVVHNSCYVFLNNPMPTTQIRHCFEEMAKLLRMTKG